MANPSTVWAQLALPYSPIGSLPYVANDGVTIVTDNIHYSYTTPQQAAVLTVTPNTGIAPYQLTVAGGIRTTMVDKSLDPAPTVTINAPAGVVKIPIGRNQTTILNNYVTTSSLIFLQNLDLDAVITNLIPVTSPGQFIIKGNAVAVVDNYVIFFVLNTYLGA